MLKRYIADNLYSWIKNSTASPSQLSITPTNICNLSCQSCWQRDRVYNRFRKRPPELSEEKLLSIIKEASEVGVKCVELTGGGEPLARRSIIAKLIREIKRANMIGWITTNGTLFSPDIIELMVDMGWDKLTISVDGPDADINDFLRPPAGTFEKITRTLSIFNKYKKEFNKDKPALTFNVVISKYNINRLDGIIELANRHGVDGVTFEPIKILAEKCNELTINFEKESGTVISELEKAQGAASKQGIFTNIEGLFDNPELIKYSGKMVANMPLVHADNKDNSLLNVPCFEPWFHIYVEVDGNVRPCCVSQGLGENINHNSLKEIWFGKRFSDFRNAIVNKNYVDSCNQCNANLICFSNEIKKLLREKLSDTPIVPSILSKCSFNTKVSAPIRKKQLKTVITDTAPLYPPRWGGPKRIWNLYSNFSKDLFDITYVGVSCELGKEKKYNFKRINTNLKEILCAFPPHYYIWHSIDEFLFKNTSLDLFTYIGMHTDWQFRYILNSQKADLIICSHPWSSLCIKKNKNQFFIYDAHNCEYLLIRQILKKYLFKDYVMRQVRKVEADACKKSDLILACSKNEKHDIINLYGVDKEKIIIVPNGTTIAEENSVKSRVECRRDFLLSGEDKVIIFIGAYYKPNIVGASFIVERLADELKEFKFLIVGTVKDAFIGKGIPDNTKFLGRLSNEQLDIALRASDIAINPMREGSGINIKMLDYMSYGLPIITTECGARGIEPNGYRPFLISHLAQFATAIKNIFNDKQIYKDMSSDGRRLVAENYDWKTISNHLEQHILERLG